MKVRGTLPLRRLAVALGFGLMSPLAMGSSLLQLHELATTNDPQFQADFYGKQATDERYYQARSALLPQVSVNASRSEITQDIVSSDNEVFDSGSTSYPTTVYGVSIEQSLYDYSRWAAFSQAKQEIQQAASELEAARQDLYLRVAERYFTALALHENLSFLRAEKQQVGTNRDQVRARHEDGLAREIDLLDAEARFLQVEARELDVENRLRDALNALEEVTGVLPNRLRLVNDNLQLERPQPDSPDAWTELALQRNPRLQAASLAVDVAMQNVRVRRGGHFPTLGLSLNYENDDTEGSLFGGGSQVETQTIRLGLNVPVYSGGMVSSQVREGEQLIEAGRARQEQVRRELQRNVRAGYQGIVTAMARERALRESLRANERIAESRQVGFESGVIPLLDLLDAERDLFFARSELASARYDYLISVLRLKHAAGVINREDLAEIDALMSQEVDLVAFSRL
ncbi:TolC family outer membrane protein [Halomonas daqingensis]|uniref:TolC family outer membrane protein n=1 Tax=Billgrantia desiderata TaxID=52021 RepID=A0AAW4YR66_9GAMM|nr:TolC family outer membrane protein [Halomonas desiderata]MCE8040773.1 TolC family outer membrane protein [Halomonas desiderata]MCE8045348.1 TolC family outer membrane protein [Halomonas desiderata]MCE8050757.1 TolC family outer membrane protein [Halomonas desiderata]